jgi:sugar lactone lactonase YvrE
MSAIGIDITWAGEAGGAGYRNGDSESARFRWPASLGTDLSGNLYIADTRNHVLRKLDTQGQVTTLAGRAGEVGSADGVAQVASFNHPTGLSVDGAGNIYLADWGNHTIRRVSSAGTVTTVAGKTSEQGGNDGVAEAARFAYPADVAVDGSGNLLVADAGNRTIRRIGPNGEVTTLAGQTGSKGSADGFGPAARFDAPVALAVGLGGDVYVADCWNHTLRRIGHDGMVITLAGRAASPGNDDGPGEVARFCFPADVAVDDAGDVYVADSGNRRLRKVTPEGIVSTVGELQLPGFDTVRSLAGPGWLWYPDPNFMFRSAVSFLSPLSVTVGRSNVLYLAHNLEHVICRAFPALADRPVVDLPTGPIGVPRQLDTAPQTATAWYWRVIRRPAGSTAELSSATVRNPVFIPDVADLYVFRLQATNAAGAISVGNVEVNALGAAEPFLFRPSLSNGNFQASLLTDPGTTYRLEYANSLAETNWSSFSSFTGDGTIKMLMDVVAPAQQRFYRLRVQ